MYLWALIYVCMVSLLIHLRIYYSLFIYFSVVFICLLTIWLFVILYLAYFFTGFAFTNFNDEPLMHPVRPGRRGTRLYISDRDISMLVWWKGGGAGHGRGWDQG